MLHLRYFLLGAVLCYNIYATKQDETLKVSVYYEALCPDSVHFIIVELYPSYQRIGGLLDLDFVPYGFAKTRKVNGHWYFSCQHGPRECYGNKIQACSLQQNVTQTVHLSFINCLMSTPDSSSTESAKQCALKEGVSWRQIDDCLTSGRADDLLAAYGTRTNAVTPKITFIPTIIFNDVYNETLQDGAKDDFLRTACELLDNRPKGCSEFLLSSRIF